MGVAPYRTEVPHRATRTPDPPHKGEGKPTQVNYSPNTYSIEAGELCLSSGYSAISAGFCRAPANTAMYYLPLIANAMGGARKAAPALKLHNSCRLLPS